MLYIKIIVPVKYQEVRFGLIAYKVKRNHRNTNDRKTASKFFKSLTKLLK